MGSRSSSEPEPEMRNEEVMITNCHLEVWLLIKKLSTKKRNA